MAGTVVFDLDGTLVDTSADLIAAANACFRARGLGDLLDPVADALTAFHGGRAMLRAGFARTGGNVLIPPAAVDEDYDRLLDFYARDIARHSVPYPGVEAALADLAAAGWRLTVCTNKPEALAEQLLRLLGLRDWFGGLVGADTLPVRKPDPRPYREAVARAGGAVENSFLVGDTRTDHATARAAGVRVALVGFGPEGAGVSRLGPDAILDAYEALPALARDWLRPA